MKQRGETQFPEAGVRREGPTYAVYTGTQARPAVTGIWRRKSANIIHSHAMTPEGTASRRQKRADYAALQEENRQHIENLRTRRLKGQ